ncbi:MAG: N-acetylglutamate kinase/N2-acetyl-L-aminoadipate kinase [halophilic archaeon J07HX64]|jgi:N-acetylglutamate kinase (EC 2.7.2.8)/N2-acetyl-L-aminoadipate kinase (EC 2.7.2.-)|nr:MAG: N-acetylglutamate kinase/N2-acetyl-L-aminoadipate kinase [halophilic archaeon J07HX64]
MSAGESRASERVVVKIGGARAVDPAGALGGVAELLDSESGYDAVLTHGGSTAVDETLERLGIDPEYVETPSGVVGRFTDRETMEVFEMVLPGRLNTDLVAGLRSEGVDAVGLSGVDGGLLSGPRRSAVRVLEDGKRKIRRGDHSGSLRDVDGGLLETLLSSGYTPVVSPPMAGIENEDGEAVVTPVNVDADRAAAAVAAELDATLLLLTDVPGVLADPDDETTLFGRVETPADWERLTAAAEGFMRRKLMAVEAALQNGTARAIVADANAEQPVRSALDGGGTHIHASALGHSNGDTESDNSEIATSDRTKHEQTGERDT